MIRKGKDMNRARKMIIRKLENSQKIDILSKTPELRFELGTAV
jgi:hypothetical protein